eukprot:2522564-Pyramimonas_sp.AAC.1
MCRAVVSHTLKEVVVPKLNLILDNTVPDGVANRVAKKLANAEKEKQRVANSAAKDPCLPTLQASNVRDLAKEAGFSVMLDAISCNTCDKVVSIAPGSLKRNDKVNDNSGLIRTDQPFKVLKRSVQRHLVIDTHKRALNILARKADEQKRANNTGIVLARNAFTVVREALPYTAYERLVLEDHLKGLPVGSLNHSRKLMPPLVRAMFSVTVDQFGIFLRTPIEATKSEHSPQGRPPPFSLVADKVTEHRRTGQIMGIIFLNEGELKAFMAGDEPVNKGHDGPGVAVNLLEVLQPYQITDAQWTQQFTSTGFDGQYLHLNVHEALCTIVGVSPKWVGLAWDGSHKLELVLSDCRDNVKGAEDDLPSVEWDRRVAIEVSELQVKFRYGKGYEECLVIAKELHTRLYSPSRYCDTRFAQSERKVYKNFCMNLNTVYVKVAKESEWTGKEGHAASERLLRLTDFSFVSVVVGLVDVLKLVKDLSLSLQTVNALPWKSYERCDTFFQDVTSLKESLDNKEFEPRFFPFMLDKERWGEGTL